MADADTSGMGENTLHHPGFYGGLENELSEYKDYLDFDKEYPITKESVVMDMRIVKKKPDFIIENEIAEHFKQFNIVEYKAYNDELSIDDFFKVIGYAGLYKGYGETVNAIPADELTISLFRNGYPREMFKELERLDGKIEKKYNGVYNVKDISIILTQVIVIKELRKGTHKALSILAPGADEEEIKAFLEEYQRLTLPGEKNNARAVIKVSAKENQEIFQKIWRNNDMKDILDDIMNVDERINEKVEDSQRQTARDMILDKRPLKEIERYSRLPEAVISSIAKAMGMTLVRG